MNYAMRKADATWGAAIHAAGRCAVGVGCSGPLEAHHLIRRSVKATRHAVENGILLCAFHHRYAKFSPHAGPKAFGQWLEKNMPDRWAWMQEHKHERHKNEITPN
jgi:hypothetical protein